MSATVMPRNSSPLRMPSAVLGMLIFVVAEAMFFAGLISAFSIVRGQIPDGAWPPPGQPRLPAEATMINTLVLLASGVAFWRSRAVFESGQLNEASYRRVERLFLVAMVLGWLFLGLQGVEWVQLIREGLTARGNVHGGFFYLIVGAHGLHVLGALGFLGVCFWRLKQRTLQAATFSGVRVFWTFVVALWPVLYARVYL